MNLFMQQHPISVKAHVDTLGNQIHPRTSILPLTEEEPRALKLIRAKQKQASLQKASELSVKDSVKLNLIKLYPPQNDLFTDNPITRVLHPADTLGQSTLTVLKQQSSSATGLFEADIPDSLSILPDSVLSAKPHEVVTSAPAILLDEKAKPQTGMHHETEWLIPVVLILVFFAGIIKSFSGKYINNLFRSVFNQQNADNLYQMVNLRNSLPSLSLDLLFVLNAGLFIFLALKTVGLEISGIPSLLMYLGICGGLITLILLKTGIYKFLGYVFALSAPTSEFIFYVFLYTRTVALILLPITVGMAFADSFLIYILLQTGLVLLTAMYLIQLFRGIKIFLRNLTAMFYLFLYLCALEILPILMIFKVITP
ncbi:MAG: DUF4271 domain-containing protein [Breznakibacter sp.]